MLVDLASFWGKFFRICLRSQFEGRKKEAPMSPAWTSLVVDRPHWGEGAQRGWLAKAK